MISFKTTPTKALKPNLDWGRAERRFKSMFLEMLASSKKTAEQLFLEQAKGVARNLFAVTPPMGGERADFVYPRPGSNSRGMRVDYANGKRKGQKNMVQDMSRAFRSARTKKERQELKANPPALDSVIKWYRSNQTSRKRMRKMSEDQKMVVNAQTRRGMKKYLTSRQGIVPSGWMATVQKMEVRGVPAWIQRWGTSKISQSCNIKVYSPKFSFVARNGTNHRASDAITRRIGIAINVQANAMERWLKSYNEKLGNEIARSS